LANGFGSVFSLRPVDPLGFASNWLTMAWSVEEVRVLLYTCKRFPDTGDVLRRRWRRLYPAFAQELPLVFANVRKVLLRVVLEPFVERHPELMKFIEHLIDVVPRLTHRSS
jgi:hypothetical protein